jgi:DNA-binding transcriptional MerR regulator
MENYLTCGQAAKRLRVSISTLKRWVGESDLRVEDLRNRNGWRLFSEKDLVVLRDYKKQMKRSGKRFNEVTLLPINVMSMKQSVNVTTGNMKAML